MPNKMLIDASHPEETRVVVLRGNRIEEFDFESQDKKQLKGNIYLARVTRVEPSLQAAFIEYGGNRHGFLAFSEIHPDYYQIPVADRQALLRAEAEEHEAEDDEEGDERRGKNRRRRGNRSRDRGEGETGGSVEAAADDEPETLGAVEALDESVAAEGPTAVSQDATDPQPDAEPQEDDDRGPSSIAAVVEGDVVSEPLADEAPTPGGLAEVEEVAQAHGDEQEVESVGAEDALEEVRNRRKAPRRHYKIQEVIKRRQILLVQVVKEERGNKGAALTTYLSLAGRYSVLMPNTARGGGISRKITNVQDRKRLKEVVSDLEVPQGMGVILRTAGESRTKAEIKRDYEYLMRLWDNVRTLTLQSTAPALVYEEGSLIKRSVRDLYNKDIDDIQVAGENGYREAKDFMRMLMPSHAKVVQPYRDTTPLFVKHGVESQLDRMLQPQVTLKSGGYIIINQTEALVAIDVNSGRSTREHSIEETALHTNLEAAEEVARQLRLRDLAGLIVIDFIDMEENRNNRAVEKRLKDHLKNDRARIQLGRISHFGLMEMSRQRIRASVLESTMKPCPQCGGTGHVRSDSSVALLVIRAIEEFLLKDSRSHITVRTPASTALYVLNHKRSTLADLEARFGLTITIEMDETVGSQHYAITRGAIAERPEGLIAPSPTFVETDEDIADKAVFDEEIEDDEDAGGDEPAAVAGGAAPEQRKGGDEDGQRDRKRRRRRRRRGGRDRDNGETGRPEGDASEAASDAGEADDVVSATGAVGSDPEAAGDDAGEGQAKKRRRGKRGGKRSRSEDADAPVLSAQAEIEGSVAQSDDQVIGERQAEARLVEASQVTDADGASAPAADAEDAPKKPRRSRAKKATDAVEAPAQDVVADAPARKPRAPRKRAAAVDEPAPVAAEPAAVRAELVTEKPSPVDADAAPAISRTVEPAQQSAPQAPEEDDKPKRTGWWQRRTFF